MSQTQTIEQFLRAEAIYFSTCLDARVAYEKSQILGEKTEAGQDEHMEACFSSEGAGHQAFANGVAYEDVPPLLSCVKILSDTWKRGWNFADDCLEMSHCSNCNDGTGNPCLTHG